MILRTDLALEAHEFSGDCEGVELSQERMGDAAVTRMTITSPVAAKKLLKPEGSYVTVEMPSFSDSAFLPDERYEAVSNEISRMLPEKGTVLVVGLGNSSITPDALGPRTASQVLATRHISSELKRACGLDKLRSTAVLAPGVLGQTGIEVRDIIASLCRKIEPVAVIVIDALASRGLGRLGTTVQLSDAGIVPGAGVGNDRPEISMRSLGVPVISVGVPTVVDAATLAHDLGAHKTVPRAQMMIVTPREIDLLIDRASRLLALAVNSALHPQMDPISLLSAV